MREQCEPVDPVGIVSYGPELLAVSLAPRRAAGWELELTSRRELVTDWVRPAMGVLLEFQAFW